LVRTRIDIGVQLAGYSNQNEFAPVAALAKYESTRCALGKVFVSAKSMIRHDAAAFFTTAKNILRPVTVETRKRK